MAYLGDAFSGAMPFVRFALVRRVPELAKAFGYSNCLHAFYGTEVFLHGLKGGGVLLCAVPMILGIFLHELDGEKAAADQAGIVVRPQPAGRAIAIAIDHDARKIRRFARVVTVFNDVLEAEAVRLIFEFALVAIYYRGD